MERTHRVVLALALTVGAVVTLTTPVAAQPEVLLQVDDLGPLLEQIVNLFDISFSIEG